MSARSLRLGLLAVVLAVAAPACASSTPTPESSTSAPVPTGGTPSTAPPVSTAPAGPVACAASGLAFVGVAQDGAMGSAFFTYTVRNQGSAPCWLEGSPGLRYRRADGATGPVPTTAAGTAERITVAAGRSAHFVVQTVNGYGGYPPGAPECANPATYTHLAAVLNDGSTLPLGDNGTLSIQCGGISVNVWAAA